MSVQLKCICNIKLIYSIFDEKWRALFQVLGEKRLWMFNLFITYLPQARGPYHKHSHSLIYLPSYRDPAVR